MLIDNLWVLSVIILLMMAGIYKSLWVAMLSISLGTFLASFQPSLCLQARVWLHFISGLAILAFVYFLIEAIRLAQWKDRYYHPSDDTVVTNAPLPPKNLVITAGKTFWKWLST